MVYRVDLTERANCDLSYLYAQIDAAESQERQERQDGR